MKNYSYSFFFKVSKYKEKSFGEIFINLIRRSEILFDDLFINMIKNDMRNRINS